MSRFIRKNDGSGELAGSIGDGRDGVPTAPLAPLVPGTPTYGPGIPLAQVADQFRQGPGARRHQLASALAYTGLNQAQQAEVLAFVDRHLDDTGVLPLETDAAIPTPPWALDALRNGQLDVYTALMDGIDERDRHYAITQLLKPVEDTYPQAYAPVRAFMDAVATTTVGKASQGLLEPVMSEGPLSWRGHAFAARIGDDYRIRPGLPTTTYEVRDLLHRTSYDGTLRSFDDLVTATYLRGDLALATGRWRVDHERVAADILAASFEMEEESVYQALALTYSGGRSQDGGFDAAWSPAAGVEQGQVPVAVREWLRGYGRHTNGFGAWACRPMTMRVPGNRQTPAVGFERGRTAGEPDFPAPDAGR